MPLERGALLFTSGGGWELFAADPERIAGPGSLNRFMRAPAFSRGERDPSAVDPPAFVLLGTYPVQPRRDEIDEAMGAAAGLLELQRRRERSAVRSEAEAREVLRGAVCLRGDWGAALADRVAAAAEYLACTARPAAVVRADPPARMGAVDLTVSAEEERSSLSVGRTDFSWDAAALLALRGAWTRRWGADSQSSLLRDRLAVAPAEDGAGLALRTGGALNPLGWTRGRLGLAAGLLRCELEGWGGGARVDLECVLVDGDVLLLREQPSAHVSLWSRQQP